MVRGFGIGTKQFLLGLERIQRRGTKAQAQITSGYKVNVPSDAPGQVASILRLQLGLANATQTKTNLQRVQAEVNTNESVMQRAVSILQEVNVAAAEGVDDLTTPAERAVLASEVRAWHAELVRMANSHANGRYQFAGDQDQSAPYAPDWTQPGGVVRLHNARDTRLIEDAAGNRFSVSRRAHDIFDLRDSIDAPAPGNVFHALYNLSLALDTNDTTIITAAAQQAKDAFDHVNRELTYFGTAQARLQSALDAAEKKIMNDTIELSGLREADVTAAILELNQSETHLEAALAAQAQLPRTTLFDYFV